MFQVDVRQSSVLSGPNYLELSGLKPARRYDIWVKAETSAGYGPSSKVTSIVLSNAGNNILTIFKRFIVRFIVVLYIQKDETLPCHFQFSVHPRIVSFGEILAVPWKSDLVLDCLHVGQPLPKVIWSHQHKSILENSKHQV